MAFTSDLRGFKLIKQLLVEFLSCNISIMNYSNQTQGILFFTIFLKTIYFFLFFELFFQIVSQNENILFLIRLVLFCLIFNYFLVVYFSLNIELYEIEDGYFFFFSVILTLIFLFIFTSLYRTTFIDNYGLLAIFSLPLIFLMTIYITRDSNIVIEIFRILGIFIFSFFQMFSPGFSLQWFFLLLGFLLWFGVFGPLIFKRVFSWVFIMNSFNFEKKFLFFFSKMLLLLSAFLRRISKYKMTLVLFYLIFILLPLLILWFFPDFKLKFSLVIFSIFNLFLFINISEKVIIESPNFLLEMYNFFDNEVAEDLIKTIDDIFLSASVTERFFVNDFYFLSRRVINSWAESSRISLETEVYSRVFNKKNLDQLHAQFLILESEGIKRKKEFDMIVNETINLSKDTYDYYILEVFSNVINTQWKILSYDLEYQWAILLDKKIKLPSNLFLTTPQSYTLLSRLVAST